MAASRQNLSLTKLYAKQGDLFHPSAWWAVRETPGAVVCLVGSSWAILLVAEPLGAELPWDKQEVEHLADLWHKPMPPSRECPRQARTTLTAIHMLAKQTFPTRREAVNALQAALLVAELEQD